MTRDPELRTTPSGKNVCSFTVAANRRKKVEGQPEADFFKVNAWNALGEICARYIQKGKKVCVIGSVSVRVFTTSKGDPAASMEVLADEVEFLSPRQEQTETTPEQPVRDQQTQMEVVETADLPF